MHPKDSIGIKKWHKIPIQNGVMRLWITKCTLFLVHRHAKYSHDLTNILAKYELVLW